MHLQFFFQFPADSQNETAKIRVKARRTFAVLMDLFLADL